MTKPTRQAEDKDAAVHQKGKGVAVPKHDDAVSQEKSARSAENKDAAMHQKKNDIAVPGHNVVEVQQISTEPAEDILVPKTPGTNHQYRGTAINHVGRIPEWQQVLVRCARKTRSRRGQTSPGPGGNHDDDFPGSERIRTTIQARESSGATRPNIISTKSNENDAVNAQTHLEAKNAKDQMDKNPRKRKRNQIKGKGSDRTDPAKSNKVEKPGFSAKLTKRGKRQAKKPSDQNTTEGE
ncbi:hypothetical protein E4U12_005639, partial [Claviceps purpurea]